MLFSHNHSPGFGSRSRGIWLEPEPEPSLWPGSGSTLNICLIIHENYMYLNIIWCLFWSKYKIWPTCTGTDVRTYFRKFVVSFKKLKTYVLFYPEPEPAPDKKFLEPEPFPKQAGSETLTQNTFLLIETSGKVEECSPLLANTTFLYSTVYLGVHQYLLHNAYNFDISQENTNLQYKICYIYNNIRYLYQKKAVKNICCCIHQ